MKELKNRSVKPDSNPLQTFSKVADDARNLRATYISNEIVCLLFSQVLPEECDVFRQMIDREKEPLNIDELVGERARFDISRKVKSKSFETALVTSGLRLGKSGRVGAKYRKMGKKQSSSSGDDSAGRATSSGKEDCKVSCRISNETGQKWSKYSLRVCNIAVKPDTTLTNIPRCQSKTRIWQFRIKGA